MTLEEAAADRPILTLDELRARRRDILRLAAARGASNIRVFGSVARGEATPVSDLDLLVEFEKGRSLLDLTRLERELEELLGCRVDIGTEVRPIIRDRVERDAVPL
jgi:predicted nucleotidyltransferase